MRKEGIVWKAFKTLVILLGLLLILGPVFVIFINSMKTMQEAGRNFFAMPSGFNFDNYIELFSRSDFWSSFRNSTIVTVTSVTLIVLFIPALSYAVARNMNKRYYKLLYYYILAGIFIPFQVKMLPMVKLMSNIGLLNRTGAILFYIANSTCEGIFLLVGYLASMPTDLEEAAYIDGATTNQVFYKIVRPIMKPIISTVVIKNSLWIWNDYFMPSLVLNQSNLNRTLTLYQYSFRTENSTNFTIVFAVMLLSILPIFIVYCLFQKQIVSGMMEGAVKG